MSAGYDDIKIFYKDILEKESVCKNTNVPITKFSDYILSVYEEIEKAKFCEYKQSAIELLELPQYKIKELIMDTIYSNLYCDILLILQNINKQKFGMKHEVFLTSIECNEKLDFKISRACKERFRRRMQPKRLNLVDRVAIKFNGSRLGIDSPTIIRVFKETLLIKRSETGILDISKNYADIFMSLMFDTDEESSISKLKKSREQIKAYRLWKLTNDDAQFILSLYENVLNGPIHGDKFAQLMLLEKLFGIYTIADLFSQKNGHATMLESFSQIGGLGYCSLHKQLAEKISGTNYKALREIIYKYIQPFCVDILSETVKTIINFLYESDTEHGIKFLTNALSECKKNINVMFSYQPITHLKSSNYDDLTIAIKTITRFRDVNEFYSLGVYLKENFPQLLSTRFYDASDTVIKMPIGFFFEKSYIDLTYAIKKPLVKEDPR